MDTLLRIFVVFVLFFCRYGSPCSDPTELSTHKMPLSFPISHNQPFFFFLRSFCPFFFFLCFETFLQKSNGPEHFLSGMANRFHLEGAFSHPGNNCVPLNVLFRLYHLFFPPSENQDDWTTQWLCFFLNHLKA